MHEVRGEVALRSRSPDTHRDEPGIEIHAENPFKFIGLGSLSAGSQRRRAQLGRSRFPRPVIKGARPNEIVESVQLASNWLRTANSVTVHARCRQPWIWLQIGLHARPMGTKWLERGAYREIKRCF